MPHCICISIQLLESPIPAAPPAVSQKASSDDISGTKRGTVDPEDGLKSSKMVPNGLKWSKMVQMVENGQKWSKWSKMVKNGGIDLKRAQRTGLSARRARRTKSRGPKGLQLEVGPRRGP